MTPTVQELSVRDFRTYAAATVQLGERLTVLHGPNGAGKTNLLEALYFGCTGRSCRTSTERDVIRFGAAATRIEVQVCDRDGAHTLAVGFSPAEGKRMKVDGAPVERLSDSPLRPLLSVFLPDRLELVKGPPALRRSHLDHLVAALWPARAATRSAYSRALAQRNALLGRVRSGAGSSSALDAWDQELARHGIALREDRAAALAAVAPFFTQIGSELGLEGEAVVAYRPRTRAADAAEFAGELLERRGSDLERGFSQHGPHRDDVALLRDGRELRSFGSQGEQRLALLALLLAEREVLGQERGTAPMMLLDDVMSELDAQRRTALIERLAKDGQALITTTDLAHVPGAGGAGIRRLAVGRGSVLAEAGGTAEQAA